MWPIFKFEFFLSSFFFYWWCFSITEINCIEHIGNCLQQNECQRNFKTCQQTICTEDKNIWLKYSCGYGGIDK